MPLESGECGSPGTNDYFSRLLTTPLQSIVTRWVFAARPTSPSQLAGTDETARPQASGFVVGVATGAPFVTRLGGCSATRRPARALCATSRSHLAYAATVPARYPSTCLRAAPFQG